MSGVLPLGEDDGAQNGDENQEGSKLERVDEILEEEIGKRFGGRGSAALCGGLHHILRARNSGGKKPHQRHAQRNACEASEFREIGALLDSGIEQHDDEDEEHHDGAAVDDDLHGGHEFRAHQQIEPGKRNHDHDERERAVNRMALEDQANCASDAHGRERKENNQRSVHLIAPPKEGRGSEHDVGERGRQEQLPAKGHELVIAEARERAAHPDVDEKKDEDFGKQPEGALDECVHGGEEQEGRSQCGDDRSHRREYELTENCFVAQAIPDNPQAKGDEQHGRQIRRQRPACRKRGEPAAEEENRAQTGHRDHTGVLGDKEHGEFEAGVFGVKTADEFLFSFGKVEGGAIGFRDGGDEEAEEAEDLRKGSGENVPVENSAPAEKAAGVGLSVNDVAQAELSGHEQHADYRHGQREFVADHLRGAAQAAEKRIFVVGGPSGEGETVNAQSRDGEECEDADVEVDDAEINVVSFEMQRVGAKRNYGNGRQRERESQQRR